MLTEFMLGLLIDTHAGVAINIQMEARMYKEVRDLMIPFRCGLLDKFRALVDTAVLRGELHADTSARLPADVVVGAVTNHVLATPLELEGRLAADRGRFALKLVDLIMGGVAVR